MRRSNSNHQQLAAIQGPEHPWRNWLLRGGCAMALAGHGWVHAAPADAADAAPDPSSTNALAVQQVIVTALRPDLVGVAATASEGSVNKHELELRPVYRIGQLLETVPGLVATSHSGEGKANQYLLRGFNLDHGTDLATYVDDMPVNGRTHTHGQGYTDLNFMIPELATGLDFTKGPYHASVGDFGSVGATRIRYADRIDNQLSVMAGTVGDRRVFAGGTLEFDGARLLGGVEVVRFDGPWEHADGVRKLNAVLRYSVGGVVDGQAFTAMFYRNGWNATTDQPQRAVRAGLIGRFGALDPTDGGESARSSLSARVGRSWGDWQFMSSAYAVSATLTLWNNFTHLLSDPVNGDQHEQNDRRTLSGGEASLTHTGQLFGMPSSVAFGLQARHDSIEVDLRHTVRRAVLETARANRVRESSLGIYAEATTHWTPALRSVVGARADYFCSRDRDRIIAANSGGQHQSLVQPKLSVAWEALAKTEFYVSAGTGFHSNDARSGLDENGSAYLRPPLLVKSRGSEIGMRTSYVPGLQLSASAFQIKFDSELIYNGDAGATEAGRPSQRRGVELTGQYRPAPWLALNANLAFARARFSDSAPGGNFIEDAPDFVASGGVLIDNMGPWFGALALRNLGAHPLVSDNSVRSPGYSEWNASVGYKVSKAGKVRFDVFNLLGAKSNAADYYYASRLAGESAEGVLDRHSHPLEPRSARLTLSYQF